MRLIFLRHGEPEWHGDDGLGRTDPPLTELGRAQAVAASGHLADEGITDIWVSPAARSQQTAIPVAERLGIDPVTKDWALEVQIPVIGGKTKEQVRKLFGPARLVPVQAWWQGIDGCEAYSDFTDRVSGGLDHELETLGAERFDAHGIQLWTGLPADRTVLCVCHAGTTAVAVSHLVGLGQVPWSWIRLPVGHAGLAECKSLRMSEGRIFQLARLDDREHLERESRTH